MGISGINTNFSSQINRATSAVNRSAERIASGSRINNARDDAAGLANANRLTSQINGFAQASRNANDGISFLQTADAGLSSLTDGIQRIRELALQAANGTLTDQDRSALNSEAQQIKDELTRTIDTSQFNNKSLYKSDDAISLQVGPGEGDTLDVSVGDFEQVLVDTSFADIDLSTAAGATSALGSLDSFQDEVNTSFAGIGAGLNRLGSTISNLAASEISAQASRSRIDDADIAKEVSDLAANEIKQNVAIAMQSQANAQQGFVLKFLSGL